MTTGMLQETIPSVPPGMGPKFRPYASPNHHVTKGRYITSNDPRGYIPVYEYPLNGQWIMMDIDDGYILWTGIWKALGNSKADIVKMIDSQPDLAPVIRRVRGGYLKIQGTWMPYEVALRLSRRVAWPIREDLIPLFGPTFPSTCLSPNQPGYGQVVASAPGRRRARRQTQTTNSSQLPSPTVGHPAWSVITQGGTQPDPRIGLTHPMQSPFSPPQFAPFSSTIPESQQAQAHQHHQHQHHHSHSHHHHHHHPHHHYQQDVAPSSDKNSLTLSLPPPVTQTQTRERGYSRYSPYPGYSPTIPGKQASTMRRGSDSIDIPSLSIHSPTTSTVPRAGAHDNIVLPPITPVVANRSVSANESSVGTSYALPPISALEDLRGVDASDSAAVLRRLKSADDDDMAASGSDSSKINAARLPSSWPSAAPRASYVSVLSAPGSAASIVPRLSTPSVHSLHSHSSRESFRDGRLSVSLPSDTSGSYSSHPSPVSPPSPSTPATPQSASSFREGLVPLSVLTEHGISLGIGKLASTSAGPGNSAACARAQAQTKPKATTTPGGTGTIVPTPARPGPGHLYESESAMSDYREGSSDANDVAVAVETSLDQSAKCIPPLSRRERDWVGVDAMREDGNHGMSVRLPHRPW